MTDDDETIPVRVKDLEQRVEAFSDMGYWRTREMVSAYLPKPKLVTVDMDELKATQNHEFPVFQLDRFIERLEKKA